MTLVKEGQDVNEKHQGVLVFASKEAPTFVPWDDINEIEFNYIRNRFRESRFALGGRFSFF